MDIEIVKFPSGKFGARRKIYSGSQTYEYISASRCWFNTPEFVNRHCQFTKLETLKEMISGHDPSMEEVLETIKK